MIIGIILGAAILLIGIIVGYVFGANAVNTTAAKDE